MPSLSIKKGSRPVVNLVRRSASLAVKRLWPWLPRGLYQNIALQSLNVALTRVCNADCVFCPYQFADKAGKVHMSAGVFDKVLEGIREAGIQSVMLSPDLGEPLLAPDFMERVKQLRAAGVKLIQLTTNATCLHRVGIGEMVSSAAPDLINLSFPGFDRAMYERVYRSKLYDQTRQNILDLLRVNAAAGRPKTITLRLRGDLPEQQLLAFPEMKEVTALADDVTVFTGVDDWIGRITQAMLPGELKIQKERNPLTKRPCAILFNLTVHPDGDLHLCSCRNIFGDPDLHIGNLKTMTILEGYRGIFEILRKWESGKIPVICKTCCMYCDPAGGLMGRIRRTLARRVLGNYYF